MNIEQTGFKREKTVLLLILAISILLTTLRLHSTGYGNLYYAAAVKSMLQNWHNFFFVSYDPAGFISVDKPPLGLWIQTCSALIFGYKGWSLLSPQVLASAISVILMFYLVKKPFGPVAGLLSAFILAATPIFVAVSRTNELDALLVMVCLLAALAVQIAAERGSLGWLIMGAVLIGLGFNIKTLEAFMALPAFFIVYSISPAIKMSRKIFHLFLAAVVILMISFSWITIVDLTPAGNRPYVGGSLNNSEFNLALGYNGIERLFPSTSQKVSNNINTNEGGQPGLFRFFNKRIAGQISWLLPLALLGFYVSMAKLKKINPTFQTVKRHALYFWGAWVGPMIIYFCVTEFFHRFYLCMLAPGIAALAGIGIVELWKSYDDKGFLSWGLPAGLALTAVLQLMIMAYSAKWVGYLILLIVGIHFFGITKLLEQKTGDGFKNRKTLNAAIVSFAVLIITPIIWTVTPIIYGDEMVSPVTGPGLISIQAKLESQAMDMTKLERFLMSNYQNETFLVSVHSAKYASPIIIDTGKPVMTMGGYAGRDVVLSVKQLQRMVNEGKVRYFLIPRSSGKILPSHDLDRWIMANGKVVPQELWEDDFNSIKLHLYECHSAK